MGLSDGGVQRQTGEIKTRGFEASIDLVADAGCWYIGSA